MERGPLLRYTWESQACGSGELHGARPLVLRVLQLPRWQALTGYVVIVHLCTMLKPSDGEMLRCFLVFEIIDLPTELLVFPMKLLEHLIQLRAQISDGLGFAHG